MSDWIPVPEIENVLIVLAELADNPGDISQAPVMPLLDKLKQWHGGSVYVFHNPPEAGEVLEDAAPEMAAKFALAAQMSDWPGEVCRDAFRRVFSRATVQRVVLVSARAGDVTIDRIDQLFADLDHSEFLWAGEWPGRFALGLRSFQPQIFSRADTDNFDLRKAVEEYAEQISLNLRATDAL